MQRLEETPLQAIIAGDMDYGVIEPQPDRDPLKNTMKMKQSRSVTIPPFFGRTRGSHVIFTAKPTKGHYYLK